MCRNLDYVSNSYRNHRILIRLVVLNVWTHPHIWDVVPQRLEKRCCMLQHFPKQQCGGRKGLALQLAWCTLLLPDGIGHPRWPFGTGLIDIDTDWRHLSGKTVQRLDISRKDIWLGFFVKFYNSPDMFCNHACSLDQIVPSGKRLQRIGKSPCYTSSWVNQL